MPLSEMQRAAAETFSKEGLSVKEINEKLKLKTGSQMVTKHLKSILLGVEQARNEDFVKGPDLAADLAMFDVDEFKNDIKKMVVETVAELMTVESDPPVTVEPVKQAQEPEVLKMPGTTVQLSTEWQGISDSVFRSLIEQSIEPARARTIVDETLESMDLNKIDASEENLLSFIQSKKTKDLLGRPGGAVVTMNQTASQAIDSSVKAPTAGIPSRFIHSD